MNSKNYSDETKLLQLKYQIENLKAEIKFIKSLGSTDIYGKFSSGDLHNSDFMPLYNGLNYDLLTMSNQYVALMKKVREKSKKQEKKKNVSL